MPRVAPPPPPPTPAEIAAACLEIQASWTEHDYLRRRLGGPGGLSSREIDELAAFCFPEVPAGPMGLRDFVPPEYPIPSSFEASSFKGMTRRATA